MVAMFMALGSFAQAKLTENGQKAQRALIDYLRSINITPSIYSRDNSVNFKHNDVSYWVTFDKDAPVLYTMHRKGINFEKDANFKQTAALVAANKVNRETNVKCLYNEKRVDFIMAQFAKDPSDFHNTFKAMLSSFASVEKIFKEEYERVKKKIVEDSIKSVAPIVKPQVLGVSPLHISRFSVCCVDAAGNFISGYDQAIRSHGSKFIKEKVVVKADEPGIYKIGVRIYSPEGKIMLPQKSAEYTTATNFTIEKKEKGKEIEVELDKYGEDKDNAWKAGEYKIEIYDFEKGALLYESTFNVL